MSAAEKIFSVKAANVVQSTHPQCIWENNKVSSHNLLLDIVFHSHFPTLRPVKILPEMMC